MKKHFLRCSRAFNGGGVLRFFHTLMPCHTSLNVYCVYAALFNIVKFNKAQRDLNKICAIFDDTDTSLPLHGVLKAIMAMLRSFHGFFLAIVCVWAALILRSLHSLSAFTALMRSSPAPTL
jgi:hypothetical protein